jgi:hypothetical protein
MKNGWTAHFEWDAESEELELLAMERWVEDQVVAYVFGADWEIIDNVGGKVRWIYLPRGQASSMFDAILEVEHHIHMVT